MNTCPVCNSPLNPQDETCAACGYRLQETTEEFKVVSLESENTDIPRHSCFYADAYGVVWETRGYCISA